MGEDADIIQVQAHEFLAMRRPGCNEEMKKILEASIAAAFRSMAQRAAAAPRGKGHRSARKPVEQWKSTRATGKRPLKATDETASRNAVYSICNKMSTSNWSKLKLVLFEHADGDADMVVAIIVDCLMRNGYYLQMYVKTLREMRRRHAATVDSHVDAMCAEFLSAHEVTLCDQTDAEDYDQFCAYVAEKKRRLTRFEFLTVMGRQADLSTTLPEMVTSLGERESTCSKDMMICMLGIYYNRCNRVVGPQELATYEAYIKNSREHGIGSKAKFSLIDMVTSVRKIRSA